MTGYEFRQWCTAYFLHGATPPLVMGILNTTPDSFSGDSVYRKPHQAVSKALAMIEEGADLIDVGGESSRPGALAISEQEELERVLPVIEALRAETDSCLSIDTTKAAVMKEAVSLGVTLINDIKALTNEGALGVAASLDVPVCLMHMQGEPAFMQDAPQYEGDILDEINLFFQQRIELCLAAGIKRSNLILDPGFGFGKQSNHNLRIVQQFKKFKQHNLPLMLGVSRKSTLGLILGKPVEERLVGGLGLSALALAEGVGILRTHDVAPTKELMLVFQAIKESSRSD